MKVVKFLVITLIIYFIFSVILFVSVNSPKEGSWYGIYPGSKKTTISLKHLFPELSYRVYVFINKDNDDLLTIFDENKNKIYETSERLTPGLAINLTNISRKEKINYFFLDKGNSNQTKIDDIVKVDGKLVYPPNLTVIRTVIARAPKNFATYIFINKLFFKSLVHYLTEDVGFNIFYFLLIITLTIALIKTKKDLKS